MSFLLITMPLKATEEVKGHKRLLFLFSSRLSQFQILTGNFNVNKEWFAVTLHNMFLETSEPHKHL